MNIISLKVVHFVSLSSMSQWRHDESLRVDSSLVHHLRLNLVDLLLDWTPDIINEQIHAIMTLYVDMSDFYRVRSFFCLAVESHVRLLTIWKGECLKSMWREVSSFKLEFIEIGKGINSHPKMLFQVSQINHFSIIEEDFLWIKISGYNVVLLYHVMLGHHQREKRCA